MHGFYLSGSIKSMDREQKMYEIGYLLSPLIPEEKLDEEVSVLRKLIEDRQGLIINEGRPKMRKLAYPINKTESAYFGWVKFTASPEILKEIENPLKKNNKIIRFLIIKAVKETTVSMPARKIVKKKKPAGPKEKIEIKPEEIDKKLEELLSSSQ